MTSAKTAVWSLHYLFCLAITSSHTPLLQSSDKHITSSKHQRITQYVHLIMNSAYSNMLINPAYSNITTMCIVE